MITDKIIKELREAYEDSTMGEWKIGKTTHDTVSVLEGSEPYHIATFHHADDAEFCDVCHKHMPAILSALESMRWVPVTERLPGYLDNVTMCLKGEAKSVSFEGYLSIYDTWMHNGIPVNVLFGAVKVTHWMPLPQPPKE